MGQTGKVFFKNKEEYFKDMWCGNIWHPVYSSAYHISRVGIEQEKIQTRATKRNRALEHFLYEARIQNLMLLSGGEKRQQQMDMIEVYKIIDR